MPEGLTEAIKAGGAGPYSFAALAVLLTAWLVSRLFNPSDHIRARVFVFSVLILGLGLLVVALFAKPDGSQADPTEAATATATPSVTEPASPSPVATNPAPADSEKAVPTSISESIPTKPQPTPTRSEMALDELTALSDPLLRSRQVFRCFSAECGRLPARGGDHLLLERLSG
jgi:cell division septation protein DedD